MRPQGHRQGVAQRGRLVARISEIVIDALHPAALARFWAAALDGYAVRPYDAAEVARLAAMGRTPETDPQVAVDGPAPEALSAVNVP